MTDKGFSFPFCLFFGSSKQGRHFGCINRGDDSVLVAAELQHAKEETMSAARGTSLRMPTPSPVTREGILESGLGDVFVHMRNHLISVRRYHKILFWVVMVAFVVLIAVGIYKLMNGIQTTREYLQTFGSAGIAGALLCFVQRVLWANRVSQLSLALFESQVAEVSESLSEIPKSASTEERRRIRAEIWNNFRTGLNRIWLVERNLLYLGRPRK